MRMPARVKRRTLVQEGVLEFSDGGNTFVVFLTGEEGELCRVKIESVSEIDCGPAYNSYASRNAI